MSTFTLSSSDAIDRQTMAYHVRLLTIAHSSGNCSPERLQAALSSLAAFRDDHGKENEELQVR